MSKLYKYVGPIELAKISTISTQRVIVISRLHLCHWISERLVEESTNNDGSITATYVIDQDYRLRVAPRRSEHVSCSDGNAVLGAGEATFSPDGDIIDFDNYSTGFCPEPESWRICHEVLDSLGVAHPPEFTRNLIFRLCKACL